MTLAAGIVADAAPAGLVGFSLSADRLSDTALLDGCWAAPGRYVGEMLHRLQRLRPDASQLVVFNPYVAPSPMVVALALERVEANLRSGAVTSLVADGANRPLAYAVAAAALPELPAVHFSLLSTTDATLDARFLRASAGECDELRARLLQLWVGAPANGFGALDPALEQATENACQLLESRPARERRSFAAAAPRAAVIGYHAGDVLFTLQALALEPTRFDAVVVLEPFADIVRAVRPDLECLTVAHRMPFRDGYEPGNEHALLWRLVTELARRGHGGKRFWHLLRPYRDYRRVHHHLREAMAFSLGGRGHALRPLPRPVAERPAPKKRRLVVHLDGGWSLKEYPSERRRELLELLVARGFEPILLGRPEPGAPSVAAVPYSDLARFRALLDSADALIGADSFPSHFSQALGVPTLQLFGPTRAANSCGVASDRYRLMQAALPCVPCSDLSICALDGGRFCHAHATPPAVVAALNELLASA